MPKAAALARRAISAYRLPVDLKWRRIPRFTVRPARDGTTTVYHLTPSPDWATGGIRNAYRHVDRLNRAGIPAAVVRDRPGHRYTWFVHDTRVVDVRAAELMRGDTLFVVGYPGGGDRAYFDGGLRDDLVAFPGPLVGA